MNAPLRWLLPLTLSLVPSLAHAELSPFYSALSGGGNVGAFRYRRWHGREDSTGYQIGGGQAPAIRASRFYLGMIQGALLRWYPSEGFALGHTYDVWTSVALGPFQPEVRLGLTSLMIDRLHGQWGVQIGSPRVAAGASFRLGPVDLGAFAFSEYSWRWRGDDLLLKGVYIDLRFEGKREYFP